MDGEKADILPPLLPRARAASSPAMVRSSDHIALELCEHGEEPEVELSSCGGCIYLVSLNDLEIDSALIEVFTA